MLAVVLKEETETRLKSGKLGKSKWVRGYRAPRQEDENANDIASRLAEKLPEWEALDIVPNEEFPPNTNDDQPRQYGMPLWRDMFSKRQLLGHGLACEKFRELVEEDREAVNLTDLRVLLMFTLASVSINFVTITLE